MIAASVQTSADTVPFSSYAETVGKAILVVAAFFFTCWLVDRYLITPYLRGRIDAALGRGDAQVRAFVESIEDYETEQASLARRVR